MRLPFEGTAAVVTGASSGIGREIAISLARAGADRIVVHYRKNAAGAEHTATEIRDIGASAVTIAADIGIFDDRKQLVEQAFEAIGPIQTWVNNAGADVLTGDIGKLGFDEKLRLMMEVDVIGTIGLSRDVADRLVAFAKHVGGNSLPPSMVFMGWDQSARGMEGDAGQMFAAVKAAVTSFASSLAQTLAPHVRVNTVAPGWIRTSWGETTSPYWNDRAEKQSLMNRWGDPADIARAVCFVADPANSFVTGQTLEINGGWNRRFD